MTIKGHLEAELVQLYAGGKINLMEKAQLEPTMTIGTVRAGEWAGMAMVGWGRGGGELRAGGWLRKRHHGRKRWHPP